MDDNHRSLSTSLKRLYRDAAKNARRRGILFALTKGDFAAIVVRAGGRCELTGIAFDDAPSAQKWARRPYAPSLDRIRNAEGYAPDNCRLVCCAVNLALNTWGEHVLLAIARGILGFADAQGYADKVKSALGVRVYHGQRRTRYNARIRLAGRHKNLGTFDTIEEAHRAFTAARFATKPLENGAVSEAIENPALSATVVD